MLDEFEPLFYSDNNVKDITQYFIKNGMSFCNFIPLSPENFNKWINNPSAWECFEKFGYLFSEYCSNRKITISVGDYQINFEASFDRKYDLYYKENIPNKLFANNNTLKRKIYFQSIMDCITLPKNFLIIKDTLIMDNITLPEDFLITKKQKWSFTKRYDILSDDSRTKAMIKELTLNCISQINKFKFAEFTTKNCEITFTYNINETNTDTLYLNITHKYKQLIE